MPSIDVSRAVLEIRRGRPICRVARCTGLYLLASSHGTQLQLALEEERGNDVPFDPFLQFLDQMGTTVDFSDEGEEDDGDDIMDSDGIEEAE